MGPGLHGTLNLRLAFPDHDTRHVRTPIPGYRILILIAMAAMRGLPLIAQAPADRIRADVNIIASDRFEGRKLGEPGADSAASFIAGRFEALALSPLGDDVSRDCSGTHCRIYFQRIV